MADKAIHTEIAEKVVAGLKKATREKMSLTPKSSYTVLNVADEGWCCRITKSIAEFSPKRITEEKLEALSLHGDSGGKKLHRAHHIGDLLAVAGMDDGEAKIAKESGLVGVGLPEMIAAVEEAAKPLPKTPAKKAVVKKGEGK
jgi:hypothetical protein